MGRTNYVIGVMGLITCIALSMMMKHVVTVQKSRSTPAVVSELKKRFGSRLVAPSEYRVKKVEGGRIATVSVQPMIGLNQRRFATSVGSYVWSLPSSKDAFEALVIEVDTGFEASARFQIRRPFTFGKTVIPLGDGEQATIYPDPDPRRRSRPPSEPEPAPSAQPNENPAPGKETAPKASPPQKR